MFSAYLAFVSYVVIAVCIAAAVFVVANDIASWFYTWRANYAFKRMTRTDYTGWTGREP